jgi:uncharacterized protein YraI
MNKALTVTCASALFTALLTGSASNASAYAPCGTTASDRDGTSHPTATVTANIRTGSSTSCTAVGSLLRGHRANYYCYTVNFDSTYTWTYLRDVDTGKTGWVRDDLLPGGGSVVYCGF